MSQFQFNPSTDSELIATEVSAHDEDLFGGLRDALRPGGRFVLADVVRAGVTVAPLSDRYDKPDRAQDQVGWLRAIGLDAEILWKRDDPALLRADRH